MIPLAILPHCLVERLVLKAMRTHVGGTVLATALAVVHGWAVNIGGGMHHAHRSVSCNSLEVACQRAHALHQSGNGGLWPSKCCAVLMPQLAYNFIGRSSGRKVLHQRHSGMRTCLSLAMQRCRVHCHDRLHGGELPAHSMAWKTPTIEIVGGESDSKRVVSCWF